MKRELCKDESVLSTPCEAATPEDAGVAQDLLDTMAADDDIACLAANQIGVTKAVCAVRDDKDGVLVLYNPKVVFGLRGKKVEENCLTHEDLVKVTRYAKVKVTYDELVDGAFKRRTRDFEGWQGQMVQHMIDHCAGRLV